MFKAINEFLVKRDMDTYAIWGLWLVFLFAVLSSIMHVAAMFGDGDHVAGLLPALAIDGGLALATYALGRFKNGWVLSGFWMFLILSVFANLDYTLQRLLGGAVTLDAITRLDPWQMFKVVAKASPPLIGAMMMEINTGVSELKAQATSTALQLGASTNPKVKIEGGSTERQPRKLKGINRKLLPFQPDAQIPRLGASTERRNPQLAPSTSPSTDRKNANLNPADSSTVNPQPLQLASVEVEDETTQNAVDAVRWFSTNNNLSATARQQGVSVQAVRNRLKWLWKKSDYKARVEGLLPKWVEENQEFLHKD